MTNLSSSYNHLPRLMIPSGFVASGLLWGGTLSFYTALVSNFSSTLTAGNAASGQGTPKKVKLRLIRSINRDLSLQWVSFAHHVHLRPSPHTIALY